MTDDRMVDFINSRGYGIYFGRLRVVIWQKHKGEIINERRFSELDDAYNSVMVEAEGASAPAQRANQAGNTQVTGRR